MRLTSLIYRGTIVIAYTVMLLPVLLLVVTSFFRDAIIAFPPTGLSLEWYRNALTRDEFLSGFLVSVKVAAIATAIGVPTGTAAAMALVRSRLRFKAAITTFLLGPIIVPGIVAGIALYLSYLAVQNRLDMDIVGTLPGLIAAHVLLTIPWTVRVVISGLQGLDRSVEEAALNLGARPRAVFLRVTLPMMRPAIVAAAMFSFIQSFENLELTLLLVGPGMSTLPIAMMNYLEFQVDPTLAAVATLQIAVIAAMMLITDRYVKLSRIV
ncbi:ABC transporter permease [Pseudooceanicola sp. CBS1P-1]|uniref:ABC transporter permease subunit n=1 Tax=Pseudooceanicola albus TaxID=2692189 RepID=A0A6L7GCM8_9RHOB|nr:MULTISPECIES: ABC transporter permease [Pseudooceanicola]MBT9386756.1 ABC transporter permease [Pseudooceanicola endophyticus]MXN20980.1 ABC transporter permease subunit [Pseudooceanicola albus]